MTLKLISYILPKLRNQLTKSADFWLQSQFSMSKIIRNFLKFVYIEEYHFRGTFLLLTFFEKINFKAHYLLKLGQFVVSWFESFGKRYGSDFRVISYQWSKLCIGLDVKADLKRHLMQKHYGEKIGDKSC